MWLAISKLLPFIYLATFTSAVAVYYQRDHKNKTDYATSKWREKLNTTQLTTENPLYQSVRIRHSRFPNLDRISNRLDDIKASSKYKYARTTTTTTTTTPSDGLLDDYEDDDLNYEDDEMDDDALDKETDDENMWMMNDEQNSKDDDDFLDYEEDDPAMEDSYNADEESEEEPAEESTARSPLTEFKWRHYGTRSRVEESRRNQLKLPQEAFVDPVRAVVAHTVRVNSEGRCKKPLPKVIPVQSEHPDVSKTYIPHCTILHRCAEDTGCCNNYGTRCAPKKLKLVHLYFYTRTLGQPGNKVERLPFYNHTECACLEKSKAATTSNISFPRAGISVRSASTGNYNLPIPENIRRCRCPGEYIPRLRQDMSCSCDCSESNYGCQRIKKGKEHFSITDRRCILDKDCGMPSCEYGSYLRNAGRCPRKQEN